MATRLDRPVVRETADRDPVRGLRLMVRLEAGGRVLRVWQKGRRTRYTLTYAAVWRLGFQIAARAARDEKLAARKARRSKG